MQTLPQWTHGRERAVFYSLAATAGAALATAAYYATKSTLEQYVPIQVGLMAAFLAGQALFDQGMSVLIVCQIGFSSQYQYRPGTISGWIAKALAKYSERRRGGFRAMLGCMLYGANFSTAIPISLCLGVAVAGLQRQLLASHACTSARQKQCLDHGVAAAAQDGVPWSIWRRAPTSPRVHGWLLRHDALRSCQCPAPGEHRCTGASMHVCPLRLRAASGCAHA